MDRLLFSAAARQLAFAHNSHAHFTLKGSTHNYARRRASLAYSLLLLRVFTHGKNTPLQRRSCSIENPVFRHAYITHISTHGHGYAEVHITAHLDASIGSDR